MKLQIKKITSKAGLLIAVVGAAVVGSASTGVVMASIPDNNGDVQTCYANSNGGVRIIDSTSGGCANNETALNLSQAVASSATAYFGIKDGAVDTSSMHNITSYEWKDNVGVYCIQAAFAPSVSVTNYSDDLSSHGGLESDNVSRDCGGNYNIEFYPGAEFPDPNAYLWLSR